MKQQTVVLLSSGLDSTVNFMQARRNFGVKLAVTFQYGQRASVREVERSRLICERYEVSHKVIELPWLAELTSTSLVNRNCDVPTGERLAIDDVTISQESAKAVWVPNRNGVFLNIAASIAESIGADFVVPGFNSEEAVTFPDNSLEYLHVLDQSFSYSTLTRVKTICFTQNMNKKEIVLLGRELSAPFDLMWPCYFGGAEPCGECESCLRFNRAMAGAELKR